MTNPVSSILILFLEYRANRLRPAITNYLYQQRIYWEETLGKFKNGDRVVRDLFLSEAEISKKIRAVEDELDFENVYQLLKHKYHQNANTLVTLASERQKFWSCLEFFRQSHGLNSADSAYANAATQMGNMKTQIFDRFQRLMSA